MSDVEVRGASNAYLVGQTYVCTSNYGNNKVQQHSGEFLLLWKMYLR